jgi:hypothetical protein
MASHLQSYLAETAASPAAAMTAFNAVYFQQDLQALHQFEHPRETSTQTHRALAQRFNTIPPASANARMYDGVPESGQISQTLETTHAPQEESLRSTQKTTHSSSPDRDIFFRNDYGATRYYLTHV